MRLAVSVVVLMLLLGVLAGDEIVLKDDTRVEGVILDERRGEYLLVRAPDGTLRKIEWERLKRHSLDSPVVTLHLAGGALVRGRASFRELVVRTDYGVLRIPTEDLYGFMRAGYRRRVFTDRVRPLVEHVSAYFRELEKRREMGEKVDYVQKEEQWSSGGRRVIVVRDPLVREKKALLKLWEFAKPLVEARLLESPYRYERRFWRRLTAEARRKSTPSIGEGTFVMTRRFDVLGEVEAESVRLDTPYGLVEAPFSDVLAMSVGGSPGLGKVVRLQPTTSWTGTGLSVDAGEMLSVRVRGIIRVNYATVRPEGPDYGDSQRWRGVEVRVGTQVFPTGSGKSVRIRDGGEVEVRLDLSHYSWWDPNSIEGFFRVHLEVLGRGLAAEPAPLPPEKPSAAELLRRYLVEEPLEEKSGGK